MTDSTLSTMSWSSLYQEQVTHHAAMLSSVQGSAPSVSVLTTTVQSLTGLSYHLTQFVRQLNNSSSQQVPLVCQACWSY